MSKIIEIELALLSRWILRRFHPFIIGITGSSGKTTTKYLTAQLLQAVTPSVASSSGNLNTKTGLPLSVLGYKKAPQNYLNWFFVAISAPIRALFTFNYPKFLVLEYALDLPGDMDKIISIARPDIVIMTNISSAHIEIFKTRENIAQEKWKLALSAREAVVLDRESLQAAKDFNKIEKNVYIIPSIKSAKAENIEVHTNKVHFDFYLNNVRREIDFKFFGPHNIRNLEMASFAAFLSTGETEKILNSINKLSPLPGRGRRFLTKDEVLVIDESYNANPASMKAALDTLQGVKFARKVAVLGQMAEIGPISKEAHAKISQYAKKVSDYTIGVGEDMKDLGLDQWYQDVSELNSEIGSLLKKGDVVLVKGSRSNNLDKLIDYLEVG